MNTVNETLLHEEIQAKLEALKDLEVGSEEYEKAVNAITKLMDRAVEIDKINLEADNSAFEHNYKMSQIKVDHKDRWIKNILSALGIAIPAGITIWGTLKSLKFEETGTVTTIMGRGFINKLLPKK